MWIKTFNEQLINLDHVIEIHVEEDEQGNSQVIATHAIPVRDSDHKLTHRETLQLGKADACNEFFDKLSRHLKAFDADKV